MITVARAKGEKQMRPIDGDKIGLNDIEIVMCEGAYKKALEMLIDKINNAPTVDAVPVVRCKYCKWFRPEIEFGQLLIGNCPYQPPYEHTHGEGYCFRGVRRESEVEE